VKDLENNLGNLSKYHFNYDILPYITKDKINWLKKAESHAFNMMPNDDLHGIGHVVRIIINIQLLIKSETADPFITIFSGWLHDIGRTKERKINKHHALISGEMTRDYIKSNNIEMSKQDIEHIIECVESHSFSAGKSPKTIEAKILSDADKIDALGSIGIYRASCFQHENGTGIEGMIKHFHEKLLILQDQMITKAGIELAQKRTKFMVDYLVQMKNEYDIS
jgi:uncharacterized protein